MGSMRRMRRHSTEGAGTLSVMQSFKTLRPTTNPYIHMLDAALSRHPGVQHLRFTRARALVGRYDVLHLHWPETLFGGSSAPKRVLRRLYATALVARLLVSRTAVVRTAHNVEIPKDVSSWERRLLQAIERRADVRIVLNAKTDTQGAPGVLIPHGHYRDWFADVETVPAVPDTLAFVGLVRRYKGVEQLLETFSATAGSHPELRLRVCGNPTSDEIADVVGELAARDPRIELDLRFLSEEDFARSIMEARGLVLPYRFMHNSGAVLAALSLQRPVLVPDNDVNRALAEEVGPGWVHLFRGDLQPQDLLSFHESLKQLVESPPRLGGRDWTHTAEAHETAYRQAVSVRRDR